MAYRRRRGCSCRSKRRSYGRRGRRGTRRVRAKTNLPGRAGIRL